MLTDAERKVLKAQVKQINESISSLCKRSHSVIERFGKLAYDGKYDKLEELREQALMLQGAIMDEICAHAALTRRLTTK